MSKRKPIRKIKVEERKAESTLISAEFDYGPHGIRKPRLNIPYTDEISIIREIRKAYREHDPRPPTDPLELPEELDPEELQ